MPKLMTGPVCGSIMTWHLTLCMLPEGPRWVTKGFKRGSADRLHCLRVHVFLCCCTFLQLLTASQRLWKLWSCHSVRSWKDEYLKQGSLQGRGVLLFWSLRRGRRPHAMVFRLVFPSVSASVGLWCVALNCVRCQRIDTPSLLSAVCAVWRHHVSAKTLAEAILIQTFCWNKHFSSGLSYL